MLEIKNFTIPGLVDNVNLTLSPGSRLGVIGESGSGKTLTALAMMGLLPEGLDASGSILFHGSELLGRKEKDLARIRGRRIAMIFQEPMTALDPLMRVGKQVDEASGSRTLTRSLFDDVGLAPSKLDAFPHELSGGQRQRVLIAMALAGDPEILICDEPTTALDVTVQEQILQLVEKVVAERNIALFFVTHDLAVISRMVDDIAVMHQGRVVETGSTEQVLKNPQDSYTKKLIQASLPGNPAEKTEPGEAIISLKSISHSHTKTPVLHDIDLHIKRGQRLGIVGESGSGKTTLLKIIAGLIEPTSGTRNVAGQLQMVFQDPYSSLNPRLSIGRSIAEACGNDQARVGEVLKEVGLAEGVDKRYPHEFSGGQRQRISLARAISPRPDILLADEPVSALDASVRRLVLELLQSLVDEYQLTLVFVSHDLSVVREICSTVAVMKEGRIVEYGATEKLWENPEHEYTRTLLSSMPARLGGYEDRRHWID